MPVIFAKAPGKIILFGEHAVVFGQPAIAIPVHKVKATARVIPNLASQSSELRIQAPDIQLDASLSDLAKDHPLAAAVRIGLKAASVDRPPGFTLQISSTIPISAGMGSSAAISIAIIRALGDFFGAPFSADQISSLAYEVEIFQHGTPSGIDNNVIAHQQPVFYVRNEPITTLTIEHPTHWVIADSGEKTPTRETVSDVRKRYEADPITYGQCFDQIGEIVRKARESLIKGEITRLGQLMDDNQRLLESIGVSSRSLEHLIKAAKDAGALGAKLSGGGRGGNIIALSTVDNIEHIQTALLAAGAQRVITTILNKGRN
jgi:mevalonate kinase